MAKKKIPKRKKPETDEKEKVNGYTAEISQARSDIKTFIKKFKSDIERKKKAYQSYAKKWQKK